MPFAFPKGPTNPVPWAGQEHEKQKKHPKSKQQQEGCTAGLSFLSFLESRCAILGGPTFKETQSATIQTAAPASPPPPHKKEEAPPPQKKEGRGSMGKKRLRSLGTHATSNPSLTHRPPPRLPRKKGSRLQADVSGPLGLGAGQRYIYIYMGGEIFLGVPVKQTRVQRTYPKRRCTNIVLGVREFVSALLMVDGPDQIIRKNASCSLGLRACGQACMVLGFRVPHEF